MFHHSFRGTVAEECGVQDLYFHRNLKTRTRNNADYTEMLYNLCLGRASEAAGKADWVGRLEQGTSREEGILGFANSQEFENIIASYGL